MYLVMTEISGVKQFLINYPGFYRINRNNYAFTGNLKVENQYFYMQFRLPNFPIDNKIVGYISKGLDIYEIPENSDNLEICDFMKIIYTFLAGLTQSKYSTINSTIEQLKLESNADFDLPNQLKKLQSYKCKKLINNKGNVIKFVNFEKYPGHELVLSFNSGNDIQIKYHSLPDCIFGNNLTNNEHFRHYNTLENYLMEFLKLLEQLEEFYDNLHTIDELCYVVEPIPITLKHNWRIFKLNDEKIFVKITIDPFQPSSVDVNLIGPTQKIEIYREMYKEKAQNWDIDLDIHKNLLRIFNLMYFPMKYHQQNNEKDEEDTEYCNICYMYMLDNHIPIISCDNLKCCLIFHAYCLKEWYATLVDEKTFLNVNLGICPYCKEKLSTSFAQLLEL